MFSKRKLMQGPVYEMYNGAGEKVPMRFVFKNGEILIDSPKFAQGVYYLSKKDGEKEESQIVVID